MFALYLHGDGRDNAYNPIRQQIRAIFAAAQPLSSMTNQQKVTLKALFNTLGTRTIINPSKTEPDLLTQVCSQGGDMELVNMLLPRYHPVPAHLVDRLTVFHMIKAINAIDINNMPLLTRVGNHFLGNNESDPLLHICRIEDDIILKILLPCYVKLHQAGFSVFNRIVKAAVASSPKLLAMIRENKDILQLRGMHSSDNVDHDVERNVELAIRIALTRKNDVLSEIQNDMQRMYGNSSMMG